jgi:hypothetical protein
VRGGRVVCQRHAQRVGSEARVVHHALGGQLLEVRQQVAPALLGGGQRGRSVAGMCSNCRQASRKAIKGIKGWRRV